jgi:hypothetical protein
MSQREELAKMVCLTGWVTLHRLGHQFEVRLWSKDNGEDVERFDLGDEGARKAVDRYEVRCVEVLGEMRP